MRRQLNVWFKNHQTPQVFIDVQAWEVRDGLLLIYMGGKDVEGINTKVLSRFEYEETP